MQSFGIGWAAFDEPANKRFDPMDMDSSVNEPGLLENSPVGSGKESLNGAKSCSVRYAY
jgi:hypothetical protein